MSVTRGDIERKLAEMERGLSEQASEATKRLLPVGIGAVVLVIILTYLMGRRRGKKRTTIVEIRRV